MQAFALRDSAKVMVVTAFHKVQGALGYLYLRMNEQVR